MTPQDTITKIMLGSYLAQALRGVAELRIADYFGASRKTTAELAKAAKVHEGALRRTLRALAYAGVFEAFPEDQWGLTAVGDALRSDSPISMRKAPITGNGPGMWGPLGKFPDALVTGKPQVENVFGCDIWEYYRQHPEEAKNFHGHLAKSSAAAVGPLLESYDFTGASVIADIGGGYGTLLAGVLRKYENASGILLDRAEVLKDAAEVLGDVGNRVKCVEGNFLADDMPKADVYLLKHIMLDWNDDECVSILQGLRAAMSPTSRIVIIEMIQPDVNEPGPALLYDLAMLVLVSGRERTVGDFEELFNRSNLELVKSVRTESEHVIIEAKAAL